MTDLGTIRDKAKAWIGLPKDFDVQADRRNWIIKKTLFACLMATLVATPLAFWVMPDKVLHIMAMTLAVTTVVTPIVSHHLIMHVVSLLQEQRKLIHLANHDGMTGLMNRTYFFSSLVQMQTVQIIKEQSFGIVAIDIDHFKSINDRFGHAVGDRVIIGFAHLMQDLAPDDALVGRTGGEEFTVAMPGDQQRVERFVESLHKNLTALNLENAHTTISAGIVMGLREDCVDLCVRADAALYDAKRAGRNCYRLAA